MRDFGVIATKADLALSKWTHLFPAAQERTKQASATIDRHVDLNVQNGLELFL
jgi:hypothetical protein